MKATICILFLAIILTACVPAMTPIPTETIIPSAVPPTLTATATFIILTPSLSPTQPPVPVLTPDAIQVARWQEYQTELAKSLFATRHNPEGGYDPEAYKTALCEWDILGQESQTVFVMCVGRFVPGEILIDQVGASPSPAAIFLKPDSSIQNVVIPDFRFDSSLSQFYDLNLFPLDVQEKLCLHYFSGSVPQCANITTAYQPNYSDPPRLKVFFSHLVYRTTHPDEPPLIVLSAMPTATSTP